MKHTGLVIRKPDGTIGDISLCNEKSRNKTLERGELWVVDAETRRVLPYNRGGAVCAAGFTDRERWFEIALADDVRAEKSSERTEISTDTRDTSVPDPGAENDAAQVGTVLTELADVIAERRRTLPEGSYTTHLFSKGSSKIRKKTGEEAVELILATEPHEIASEAADLIYHMLVLLEAEGRSLGEVVAILSERHRGG